MAETFQMWPNNAQQTSESIWKTYTSFTALSATQLVAVVLPQLLSGQFLSIPPGSTQVYLTHLTAGSLQKLTFLSTKNGFNKKTPRETPLSSPDPAPDRLTMQAGGGSQRFPRDILQSTAPLLEDGQLLHAHLKLGTLPGTSPLGNYHRMIHIIEI